MKEGRQASSDLWKRIQGSLQALQAQAETRRTNTDAVAEKLATGQVFRERIHDPQTTGPQQSLLAFSLAKERYGLPLECVLEIQHLDTFSQVPGVPEYIRGVVHFRGTILSLLDLGRLFGAPESGIADIHFYIVAQAAGQRVALAAGIVEDLLDVSQSSIKLAPDWSRRTPRHWVQGIYGEHRVVLQLDAILTDDQLTSTLAPRRLES